MLCLLVTCCNHQLPVSQANIECVAVSNYDRNTREGFVWSYPVEKASCGNNIWCFGWRQGKSPMKDNMIQCSFVELLFFECQKSGRCQLRALGGPSHADRPGSMLQTMPKLWWGGNWIQHLCFCPLFHCVISHPSGCKCTVFHCSMCCTVHCLCTIFMIDGHALIRPTFAMTCQNKTMSVWLQAFGEFFWAFVMNEANIFWEFSKYGRNRSPWREGRWFATCILNNECMLIEAKQMSSKERFLDLECDSLSWSRAKFCPGQVTFLRYDVKPFPVKYGRFSTWSIQSGLFAKACFWSSQSSWMFII